MDQESLSLVIKIITDVWKLPDDGEIKLERISAGKLPDSLRFSFLLSIDITFLFFFFPFGPLFEYKKKTWHLVGEKMEQTAKKKEIE